MTAYIKISTKEYPLHEGDIRLDHPEILEEQTGDTFPILEDYAKVQFVEPPVIDKSTQKAYELAPIYENNKWIMVWDVRDKTQEEIDAEVAYAKEIEERLTPPKIEIPDNTNIDIANIDLDSIKPDM